MLTTANLLLSFFRTLHCCVDFSLLTLQVLLVVT